MEDILNGELLAADEADARMPQEEVDHEAVTLETLKQWFQESETGLYTARKASEVDRDFVDGKQWTTEEEQALIRRGQAPLVFNRMRGKVNVMIGVEQTMRSDPRAFPRTPNHEAEADSATDALRYVCQNNGFDRVASDVWDQACCVEGVAGVEMQLKFTRRSPNPEIVTEFFPYDRIGWDPHSRLHDFSDARYLLTLVWMDGEQAKSTWPHHAENIGATIAAAPVTSDDLYEDAPRFWADKIRNRLQVVRMWWQERNTWHVATFMSGGFLEPPQPSPFLDEDGEPMCGLILASGHITREGERYGAAREWVGPQQEINKRRSKALHLLSVRQTVSDPNVFNDVRKIRNELAKPDGHVQKDGDGEFTVLPTGDMAAGQLELLREAKLEIETTGGASHTASPIDVGQSGVAIQTAQQAGMLDLAPLLDHHRDWKLRVYRAIWAMVRQFWTAPQWLRITDNPETMRWTGINQPVTLGQQMQGEGVQLPPQYQADPRLQMVVGMQNQPAQIDADIIIDESPDAVTTAAQELELLIQLKGMDPNAIPTAAIIRASQLRGKDQLLEAIEGTDETRAQMQQQQEEQQAIQRRGVEAQIAATEARAAREQAEAARKRALLPAEVEETEAKADKYTAEAAETAQGLAQVLPFGAG